ncbi:hypothetical protein LOTGIDRAFT_235101 [Lottia gigantea]|uniref:Alpha-2-macroglobulin receptor-associated protein n=1 Tax=Lottia gigantea TaxID=225164 RepID=V3ZXU8_LOTGI|nr:hypothetical protein LOTGIDRAFT_235101 [Lottia gigantea]ESO87440.1 hypothetical protein LOTGIDRAFT_235101 [Lottia gigantea]
MQFVLFITFLAVYFTRNVYGNKYSKDLNNNWHENEENPFRMKKVNLLWEKAKKRLEGPKIADLYADLRIHDKMEGKLKKMKLDEMDKDGLYEAEVLTRFRNIVFKYGLEDFFSLEDPGWFNEIPENDKKWPVFTDKKLDKIWKRASLSDFSDEEIDKLREEFRHQQMKIDELNTLKSYFDENDIHEQKNDEAKYAILKDKKSNMKEINHAVKEGYMKLETMMKDSNPDVSFKDSRVYKLWALIKKTNLSEEELQSFKEELKHFEHRIEKHEYIQNQVELSKVALNEEVKDGVYPQTHLDLEDKAKHFKRKVKKIHIDLENRVNKLVNKHTEL